jgi:chromosome segregation ATPase
MLSSRNENKQDERYAGRLDVLTERVDMLASTLSTTASAIAKKDGEIAGLRRDLELRDQQLQALAARAQAGGAAADPRELHELRQTVAALVNERSKQAGTKQIDELATKVGLLGQRLETLSATVSTTAAGLAGRDGEVAAIRKYLESRPAVTTAALPPDAELKRQLDELGTGVVSTKMRIDGQASEIAALRAQLAEPHAPMEELRAMLTTLRARVESLDGLRAGVSEEQLDERLAQTSAALDVLAQRIDSLATSVETATTSLAGKEQELAALHGHFTESSSRIDAIVDDLREALGAFPEVAPDAIAAVATDLAATGERIEAIGQRLETLESSRTDDLVAELAERIEQVDKRVSSVSAEIARAKTLWPVALRSLEARLDDVVAARAQESTEPVAADVSATPSSTEHVGEDADDLLAGLRDSLQAMENVAAEMERASESGVSEAEAPEPETTHQAVAGGARIVPLRANDP